MKVFLSWSGTLSHKVALAFRDWLPGVIQEIVPYVSSEDIDKGARWSTDIAKELADSTFGILCVTRGNVNAPWLAFEAGALSTTIDKAFVTPFLFDIKRSEVDGPLLQFQSTVFEKDDLRKLVQTLNKACDSHGLSSERLSRTFEVWFPDLEAQLKKLPQETPTESTENQDSDVKTPGTQDMLEEILELSRSNQKLIRNPDGSLTSSIEELTTPLRALLERTTVRGSQFLGRSSRRVNSMMLELLHTNLPGDRYVGAEIVLACVREDLPWINQAGLETVRVLRSRRSRDKKHSAVLRFQDLIDFSLNSPVTHEILHVTGSYDFLRELPYYLHSAVEETPAA